MPKPSMTVRLAPTLPSASDAAAALFLNASP